MRRRTRRLFLAIAAIVLPLTPSGVTQSVAQARQDAEPAANIRGTVLNRITHEPIGRALVYSADGIYATFTDDHGHFELGSVAPKSIPGQPNANIPTVLLAKRPGFLSDSMHRGGEVIAIGKKDITLSLVPEALIVGRVNFPSAETADQVQVQLYRREVREGLATWAPLSTTETRSGGEYRFAGLRAGEYKVFTLESAEQDPLTAVPNGPVFVFPPRYFAAARDLATADTIRVRAGETFTGNIALESQQYFDVRIPVVGLDPGKPGGLAVSVYPQGHRGPGFELGYIPRLGAVGGSLPNGSYTIEASTHGQSSATGMINITVANRPVNGPALAVVPNTSIEVNIRQDMTGAEAAHRSPHLGSQNEPAAYVMLMSAEEVSSQRGAGQVFQAQGNPLVLTGVAPGRYWVQLQHGEGYPAYVTSGSRDLLRLPLIVPHGASVPPIEITMRYDTGDVDVVVEPSVKQPASGSPSNPSINVGIESDMAQPGRLSVYCVPIGDGVGPPMQSRSWSNGHYLFVGLAPGDYRVLAFDAPQQFEYRNPAAMRAYDSKGAVVHVLPGQKAQIQVPIIESE